MSAFLRSVRRGALSSCLLLLFLFALTLVPAAGQQTSTDSISSSSSSSSAGSLPSAPTSTPSLSAPDASSTASFPLPSSTGSGNSSGGVTGPPLHRDGGPTVCYYQGYNLTALTGSDLFYTDASGVNYAIHPCGVVVDLAYCTDTPAGGQFCQQSTTLSIVDTSAAVFPPNRGALWAQLELDGQFGVAQFLQDGSYCGDIEADREGTIVYVCNATATAAFISNVTELSECHYQAVIQTALLCPQVPPDGVSQAVGTNIVSAQCGGGIYDLSKLSTADIVSLPFFDTVTTSNYQYTVRVCDTTQTSDCNGPTSVCQLYSTDFYQNALTLAVWEPATSPIIW